MALVGCDQKALFDKFVPKDEANFAKAYLALFAAHDFDAIEAKSDPQLKAAALRDSLKQIADLFPPGNPKDIRVVGVNTFSTSTSSQFNLTFQYEYPDKWLLANVVFEKKGEDVIVKGVHVQPLRDSLENINRFTFEGKGAIHYAMLLMALLIPLFILVSLVLCVRTPIPKRKWLWVLFVLCGFFQISLNWTTGTFNMNPFSVHLLGAGFFKPGPFGPVTIWISLPLGAIIFLRQRKKWLLQPVTEGEQSYGADDTGPGVQD